MARNTSILLGEHFETFIDDLIATGKYGSVSEVVRTALRLFETEEAKVQYLVGELKKGEKSGKVVNFDRNKYLKRLQASHRK
ncbi:MAG TPA: type II toxin-antitoxin system ParD family antitoxin [Pyrinomonadaceae bacterium]